MEIPSKFDIIPIHTSDVGAFKRCRRYWDWSSPARNNLRHKVTVFGVNMPMWFGTGIHYALENYYNPELARDPVESFNTWFTLQWEGGIVYENELDLTYDIHPHKVVAVMGQDMLGQQVTTEVKDQWHVKGLRDLLPAPDEQEFEGFRDLGIGMMTYYRDTYAPKHDDFEVIAAEQVFSVPIYELDGSGKVMTAIDIREDSPNYGKKLEVHARGKRDAIIRSYETGNFGIMDHKTAETIGDDYFTKLENDEQCSNYIWASVEEAAIYDQPYKEIKYVTYNVLRKTYPQPPTELKSGLPSLARASEGTTAELFAQFVQENNLGVWFENNEKAQGYYNWLVTTGDENFIIRRQVYRNQHERVATGRHLAMVAKEMVSNPQIYPTPTGSWSCVRCQFRNPCLASDDGSDWKGMLADAYEVNRDR